MLLSYRTYQKNKTVPPRLCPYMIGPTRLGPHDWAHTIVPRHVYTQTRLCPHTFEPTHVCAHTRLYPHTFVPTHVCAHIRLCPDTFVPRRVCAQAHLCPDTLVPQHELWPDTIMFLNNNNIIIVSTRLCVNLIGENISMLNYCRRSEVKCYYLTTVQLSPAVFLLKYFEILLQNVRALNNYVSGVKSVRAQTYTLLPRHDCDHTPHDNNMSGQKCVWAQTCVGTIMCGHKRVWTQTCVGTNMCGHKRVWAQTCLGTNVCGHNREGTIVWAQVCMGSNV